MPTEPQTDSQFILRYDVQFRLEKLGEDLDYKQDMKINPMALDEAWLGHPELSQMYAMKAADADKIASIAKERLKIIEAQVTKRTKEENVKATVEQIKATVQLDEEYLGAKLDQIDADHTAAVLHAVSDNFHFSRKSALEHLVTLWMAQYYAGPKTPKELKWNPEASAATANQRSALAGKKKRNT